MIKAYAIVIFIIYRWNQIVHFLNRWSDACIVFYYVR